MADLILATTGDGVAVPAGFATHAGNAGIKDTSPDLSIVVSDVPCAADGVFTRSLFAGPSVSLCRRHLSSRAPRAIVTVSKNANVATGPAGQADADELAHLVARVIGAGADEVLVGSTGVIGRRYPMERIRAYLAALPEPTGADFGAVARAMMTTDTVPKLASARAGQATVLGVAKGSGMIEPDMATLLAYVFTDAAVPPGALAGLWRPVVDETFNSLSIDTDTSTSDSAIVLANGQAGPVSAGALGDALHAVCRSLTLQLAADGEGASKVIQVTVDQAQDRAQARRVAKAIVNSPLVKCAVHGADPNWGRVVMAIGKCWQDTAIDPRAVRVSFAGLEVYPGALDDRGLEELAKRMGAATVEIGVALGTGAASATVWGCDLTSEYVHINADYTT
ncbi:MAG TPA: bifunctional glutamate N-acetyltransferase/amino-acid acetyltransferase ArgJ [Acidimicrobiales bacterium]|nr:bifunctional glutamate N-acetyltransferase/amino-acid acetyltransferase ArgJ [Acidimicrobiales bacterium]